MVWYHVVSKTSSSSVAEAATITIYNHVDRAPTSTTNTGASKRYSPHH